MKLITAIIQPGKLAEVMDAALVNGARGLTTCEVHGFGQQYGRQSAGEERGWRIRQATLLPKTRVDIVVPDDCTETLVTAIAKCAHTGRIGDGKIWITAVDSTLRVRTGEHGNDAL